VRHWRHLSSFYMRESAGSSRLAPPGPARAWLALVRVLLSFKVAFPLVAIRRAAVPVWTTEAGRVYLSHWCDLLVLGEIYSPPREYDFHELPAEAGMIVDVGANVGFSARFFGDRYPAARIVAFEPDPEVVRIAALNLRGRDVTLRNCAVAGAAGQLELHRFAGGSWGTSSFVTFQEVTETFSAPAVTLDSIIDELGAIDILKIDVEGAEYEILGSCRQLRSIRCIVGEVHPVPGASSEALLAQLDGFEVVASDIRGGQGPFLAVRRDPPSSAPII
jgi:FkbM family methyltransferase